MKNTGWFLTPEAFIIAFILSTILWVISIVQEWDLNIPFLQQFIILHGFVIIFKDDNSPHNKRW